METMTNELTVIPRTIGMVTRMMDAVNIEDAVIVSEEEQKEHPNFIESNTSGITLEELERNCIVPSFGDNQLTISHQKFIHQVEDAAKVYFTGENFGNTEIRVSHKILGRVPGALTKRKEELRPEDETIYYQRMAFCFHIRSMSRMMNGEEVHLCIGGDQPVFPAACTDNADTASNTQMINVTNRLFFILLFILFTLSNFICIHMLAKQLPALW